MSTCRLAVLVALTLVILSLPVSLIQGADAPADDVGLLRAQVNLLQAENARKDKIIKQQSARIAELEAKVKDLESRPAGAASPTNPTSDENAPKPDKADQQPNETSGSDGFRGIKWGTSAKQAKDLTLLSRDGDMIYYTRKNDVLKIGKAELANPPRYAFYKDRFYEVQIQTTGYKNWDALFTMAGALYGEGRDLPVGGIGSREWQNAEVRVAIVDSHDHGVTLMTWTSVVIEKERHDDENKTGKDAKKDL